MSTQDDGARAPAGRADPVVRNRELQASLYGEPLSALLGRVCTALGLNQARLAEVLGLSAPMLSQLIGGQRIKIGNPAAARRLSEVVALASEVSDGRMGPDAAGARLAAIRDETGPATSTVTPVPDAPLTPVPAPTPPDELAVVRALQGLLRATASAGDVLTAAALLREHGHADLAELLRIYGAGRTDEAVDHLRRRRHLL